MFEPTVTPVFVLMTVFLFFISGVWLGVEIGKVWRGVEDEE